MAGPSLFEMLESLPKRRLHVPDAIRATMHTGAAIHYLHRQGFLYRDLKPGNVLVSEEGGKATPKVIDFGIAKATYGDALAENAGTRTGAVLGSAAQIAGHDRVSARLADGRIELAVAADSLHLSDA